MSPITSYSKQTNVFGSDLGENLWLWETGAPSPYYYDIGEIVRFRVESEEWHDQRPTGPDRAEAQTAAENQPPYSIRVRPICSENQLEMANVSRRL